MTTSNSNMFYDLPNEMLDIIYRKLHESCLRDVHQHFKFIVDGRLENQLPSDIDDEFTPDKLALSFAKVSLDDYLFEQENFIEA